MLNDASQARVEALEEVRRALKCRKREVLWAKSPNPAAVGVWVLSPPQARRIGCSGALGLTARGLAGSQGRVRGCPDTRRLWSTEARELAGSGARRPEGSGTRGVEARVRWCSGGWEARWLGVARRRSSGRSGGSGGTGGLEGREARRREATEEASLEAPAEGRKTAKGPKWLDLIEMWYKTAPCHRTVAYSRAPGGFRATSRLAVSVFCHRRAKQRVARSPILAHFATLLTQFSTSNSSKRALREGPRPI